MTAGTTCRSASVLHDYSLGIVDVAQAIHATTGSLLAMNMDNQGMALTKGTQVPQAVVNCSNLASVLWMANFGEKKRGSHLRQTVTESEDESTSDVH